MWTFMRVYFFSHISLSVISFIQELFFLHSFFFSFYFLVLGLGCQLNCILNWVIRWLVSCKHVVTHVILMCTSLPRLDKMSDTGAPLPCAPPSLGV